VNADTRNGVLQAEILDEMGRPFPDFLRSKCVPVRADSTKQAVEWAGASDLSSISGKPVKLRFYLKSGSFYSFWVSKNHTGASQGFTAAGGPGFTGPKDW
jgi:hypothetical protein